MQKEIIEGIVTCNSERDNDWSFETKEQSYSNNICFAIDEILNRVTKFGEKYRIVIEKI